MKALDPDRQFPGNTIKILGQGFDVEHPEANTVYFTHALRQQAVPGKVLEAAVDTATGLDMLVVQVPDLAGNGPLQVEAGQSSSFSQDFFVLPRPLRVVQARSVPGAKIRIFGVGFDLVPATQNMVVFDFGMDPTLGEITGTYAKVLVGEIDLQTSQEVLTVEVPQDIPNDRPMAIRVYARTAQEGEDIWGFEQLHPTFTIKRTTGLPQYATQGSQGVPVSIEGRDFPYDPFFGYGTGDAHIVAYPGAVPLKTVQCSQASADTAMLEEASFDFPALGPDHPGGNLDIEIIDVALPAPLARAAFRVPLQNIPIIFVPGTGGTSLDIDQPFDYNFQRDQHAFPCLCEACSPTLHGPQTFTYNPGSSDPQQRPRVWIGSEGIGEVIGDTFDFNEGNHYFDALQLDEQGQPSQQFPHIGVGTVLQGIYLGLGISHPIYDTLINFFTDAPPNGLGRILKHLNDPNPVPNSVYLFAYDWGTQVESIAATLDGYINQVLRETQAPKVVLITHSLGGVVSRAYYLSPEYQADQKVDQVISISGGFGGIVQPLKVITMGDNLGYGLGYGPVTAGLAEWETQAICQNWPSFYYQGPNSQTWFADDGQPFSNGQKRNRAYIRDDRDDEQHIPITPHTYQDSMDWINQHYNWRVNRQAQNFFATLSTPMADFQNGTGNIYHHRIISKGITNTTVAVRLYDAPSEIGQLGQASPIPLPINPIEYVPVEWQKPVLGDGDGTVPYHGLLANTSLNDDRVYVLDQRPPAEHFAITENPTVHELIRHLLDGTVAGLPQAHALWSDFKSPNSPDVAEIPEVNP